MEKSLTPEQKTSRSLMRIAMSCLFVSVMCCFFVFAKTDYNPVVKYYTAAGMIQQPTRVWDGIVTVTTASGQSVDISSAGFTSINSVTITPFNNSTSIASMPIISGKQYTTTNVTFNTVVSNTGALGILAGLIVPASVTGMQVHVHVDGW